MAEMSLTERGNGAGNGLLSLADLDDAATAWIVARAVELFRGGAPERRLLDGRCLGIWFTLTSTRTRTAFTVAVSRLGGQPVAFNRTELQTSTGEEQADTARVFGTMLDGLVIRSEHSVAELAALADTAAIPVVNAMSQDEHPTQGLCDLATLQLHLGDLRGRHVLYLGEGNNTASALALGVSRCPGLKLTLATPEGYGLAPELVAEADERAAKEGGAVVQRHSPIGSEEDVDIVYTTRWQTTGTSKPDPAWRTRFEPFRVDDAVLNRFGGARFMHDLPAHRGEEVTADVLDGSRAIVWDQARMKLYSAIAALEWVYGA